MNSRPAYFNNSRIENYMGYRYSNEFDIKMRILNLRKKRPNSAIAIDTRYKDVDRVGKHWMKR